MTTKQESDKLMHVKVYTPESFHTIDKKDVYLTLSEHAKRETTKDKNGIFYPPARVEFSYSDIIEIELFKQSKDIKIVVRKKYNNQNDIILVALFKNATITEKTANLPPSAIVLTTWLNNSDDDHKTLDESKYYNPTKAANLVNTTN